jgi:eukaryotic translation initiation factor 2C
MYVETLLHLTNLNSYIIRVDKRFYKPASIDRWVVVVYERQQRFNQQSADEMTAGLMASCRDVGM